MEVSKKSGALMQTPNGGAHINRTPAKRIPIYRDSHMEPTSPPRVQQRRSGWPGLKLIRAWQEAENEEQLEQQADGKEAAQYLGPAKSWVLKSIRIVGDTLSDFGKACEGFDVFSALGILGFRCYHLRGRTSECKPKQ